MKRTALAVLLALAAAGAVFAAVRMQPWTNPFGAPYRGSGERDLSTHGSGAT